MAGILAVSSVGLLFVLHVFSVSPGSSWDGFGITFLSLEELVTGERLEPTPKARPFLETDLAEAVHALLVTAHQNGVSNYEEIARADWPADAKRLNPDAIGFFDSKSHPDGEGVLFVVERHRDWKAGVLVCRQRKSEWQGAHLSGQVTSAGPDFGFRRLKQDGHFWHWYRGQWASRQQSDQGFEVQPVSLK